MVIDAAKASLNCFCDLNYLVILVVMHIFSIFIGRYLYTDGIALGIFIPRAVPTAPSAKLQEEQI